MGAGLPALVKTCALEWPQAALKAIDIETGDRDAATLASAIADELLTGGGEIEIALGADGARRTLRSAPRSARATDPLIAEGDVVVVSGGARGVTAACLLEWASACRARFILLGRSALVDEPAICAGVDGEAALKRVLLGAAHASGEVLTPSQLQARVQQVQAAREIRQTLAALTAAGSDAHYHAVAVDDAPALKRVLDQVRASLGPIRGLVHAAGVLADKRIAEKTDAQFAHVFDTKVAGLRALLDATRDDPLSLLVVFSSVSARCGNTGQADYAMANEVLAKVAAAEQRRRPGLRVKSLGWGPWEGGMVTPALRERFASLGVPMIPLDVGARMFADEMNDAGALELVLGGEPRPQALLSAGVDARVDALELRVDQASHAWLAGHAVAGMPVVPLVLVAEWLARAVRSWRPGLHLTALHDLKVLKGIRLGGFGNGGDRLRIEARPPGARELALSVLGSRGELHYSARAELGSEAASAPQMGADLPLDDWAGGPLYQDLLFHRGQFELIDQVSGISDAGIAAQLRGVSAANWPGASWELDAAALDGGLQMAVLYGQRMLGGPNLPTSIGALRSHAAPAPGPINAVVYSRRVGPASTTTDILYTDASGRRFAEMIGVQNHALPQ
ncbi:MAG: SDR family oxidoreductase [Rhodanobacteraceae bacterium]|nr:SDR family oxidoreductase [Rhodanobacteraceae bacterium]